jgi:hypothetical protein
MVRTIKSDTEGAKARKPCPNFESMRICVLPTHVSASILSKDLNVFE